jgi:hypothetical protein
MCRQIFVKLTSIKFHENPFSRSRGVTCGQMDGHTDLAKATGAFLQLLDANAPREKKRILVRTRRMLFDNCPLVSCL